MNVIGISAFYHDSACCLLRDGKLLSAVQEERFSGIKNDCSVPSQAFAHCLSANGLTIADIDLLAYYEDPVMKHQRQLWQGEKCSSHPVIPDPEKPLRHLRRITGYDGEIVSVRHHEAHAASAFCLSGMSTAAVMVLDAVGEWTTASFWDADANGLRLIEEVRFPASLGLAYSAVTGLLGFSVNEGEYKVMGLAPYGRPKYMATMRRLIQWAGGFGFRIDQDMVDITGGGPLDTPALAEALSVERRPPEMPLRGVHADIAASIQARLEEVVAGQARELADQTSRSNLCLVGGVALNCAAVGAIRATGCFKKLFVPPGAGDAGGAVGAAFLAHSRATGSKGLATDPIVDARFGGKPQDGRHHFLDDLRAKARQKLVPAGFFLDFAGDQEGLIDHMVEALVSGAVIGWCQDRMEFGPRALGSRSIFADPRRPNVSDRINRLIKRREPFRPFAPIVMEELRHDHFLAPQENPFMTETVPVISTLPLPAITHINNTARIQCVSATEKSSFADLLRAFHRRTGCPVLLNTSLNVAGHPIARDAHEALMCFLESGLDFLAVDDVVLVGKSVPPRWRELALPRRQKKGNRGPVSDTYSFF